VYTIGDDRGGFRFGRGFQTRYATRVDSSIKLCEIDVLGWAEIAYTFTWSAGRHGRESKDAGGRQWVALNADRVDSLGSLTGCEPLPALLI
jgi:hypothetical protein